MTITREVAKVDPRVLTAHNIRKSYNGVYALDGVDLELVRGEVLCLIGPSGSGKSTLLRCLNGLEQPDSGHVHFEDIEITNCTKSELREVRERVGMIFQQFNLFPHRSVLQNVIEGPVVVRGTKKDKAIESALDLLDKVGLKHRSNARISELSGGQQQRVAIARALAMEPEVMLFDEPTSSLDSELVGEVLNVMKSLADAGMTMAVVTHEMNFARRVADHVMVLDEGRLVEAGKPDVIFHAPTKERTQRFLRQLDWGSSSL